MLIKIFLAIIGGLLLIYLISRVMMKGWIDELDKKINQYLPKKDGNSKD
jgi:hypothetical protein